MPMKTDTIETQQQIIRNGTPVYLAEQAALNPGLGMLLADLTKRFSPTPPKADSEVKMCPMCNERDIYVTEEVCSVCADEANEGREDGRWVNTDAAGWLYE